MDPRGAHSRAAALQAARALLTEDGWEGVTHARVAERSGLGRATIYRHWPDPLALRRDALTEEVEVFHVTPTGDLRADLVAELTAIGHELVERGQARVIVTVIDQAARNPDLDRFKRALIDEGCSVVRRMIDDALAGGALQPAVSPDDAVDALVGPIVFRRIFASSEISPGFVATIVDGFLTSHGR